jgi:hypothetical protein
MVTEVNLSLFPVIVVALGGDVPERTLLRFARQAKTVLEGVPGVLSAELAARATRRGDHRRADAHEELRHQPDGLIGPSRPRTAWSRRARSRGSPAASP